MRVAPPPNTGSPTAEVQCLSHALAAAADDRVRRAVATVDAMPVRGQADHLIEPLRSRLARIRPGRALNFTRLLFIPLNPVIVASGAWRPGTAGVPRSALAALSRSVRQDWPGLGDLDAQLRRTSSADTEDVLRIGTPIWAEAGPRLLKAARPENWEAMTGLADREHQRIVRAVAMVMAQAPALLRLEQQAQEGERLDAELARLCVTALAASAGDEVAVGSLANFAALLMLRSPRADLALVAMETAADIEPEPPVAAQLALDFVLDWMMACASGGTLGQAAEGMRQVCRVLDSLDVLGPARPALRHRLQDVRARLDPACRARFAAAISEVLGTAGPSNALPRQVEAQARDARRFEQSARRIGGARAYDEALRLCATQLAETGGGRLTPVERERLAAILAMSEEALPQSG